MLPNRFLILTFTSLLVACFLGTGWVVPLQAKSPSPANSSSPQVTFDPPDAGQPRDSAGGASRNGGKCHQDAKDTNPYLLPLIPPNHRALTQAERPTFFVYLPPTLASKAFFSLKSEGKKHIYQTVLTLPKQSGIMSISLPVDAPALEVGTTYTWTVALMCDGVLRPDSPMVEASIERVALNTDLKAQLKGTRGVERAAIYGKAGIWYDALGTLREEKNTQSNPARVPTLWAEFLKSANLNSIANQPLIN